MTIHSETPALKPATHGENSRSHPLQLFALALLLAAGAALRFFSLARKPFWFDECFSVEVTRLSWPSFARLMWRREANMSLYYLLLRGWLHLGSSPVFIRSLSVIFSLATLPAVYWLANKLFDRRVALIATALIACNAYSIRYAQEARSYSLFVLLATLSSGFFTASIRERSSRNLRPYILCSVLAVYSHLYSLLLILAQTLSLRKVSSPPELVSSSMRSIRLAWLWIGAASLPIVIFAAKTGAGPIRWIQRPGLHDIIEFAERITGNAGLPLLFLYAAACSGTFLSHKKLPTIFRPAAFTGIHSLSWPPRFLAIWLTFPVALVLLLSFTRPLFLPRYFIFCLPALVILAAAGLDRLRAGLMASALTAMILLSLQGARSYYDHDFDLDRDASGQAANYILDHAQPGDAVIFHIAEARVPYEFFKSIRPGSTTASLEIIYPRNADRLTDLDFTGKPVPGLIEKDIEEHPRVWLVLMSNAPAGRPDFSTRMLEQILGQKYPRVQPIQFPQVDLQLYSRP